ncbi:hypothetical protein OROHE_002545 [Orobanche hederae]
MELVLLGRSLEHAKRKRKWVAILGALGLTCYGAYRFYNLPSVVKKRQRLLKLFTALVSIAEMMSDSADAIGILSKDMKEFLGSDSDQIPRSLKQVSKLATSDEFSDSLTRFAMAATRGILRGYRHESTRDGESLGTGRNFSDKVVDKLFTEAGSGFASVVVGSFARNLVMALYSEWKNNNRGSDLDGFPHKSKSSRWVDVACEDKCRELIGDCIRSFVSTAVAVYLDRTANINIYNEIFSGLTNPKHEDRAREMLVSVCNGAVETLIRTSHNVYTTGNPKLKTDFEDGFSGDEKLKSIPATLQVRKSRDTNRESGWVRKMSSALAVPSNRKLVMDMTGVVTFETVRSFLEFLLQKMSECVRRSVDRGVETVIYVGGKSSAVTNLCITLCLDILNSPWVLAPY